MTKVIGDVENVLGVRVDGFAQFWAPTTYVYTGVAVVPDADTVPIKAGKFTTEVTPGRCRVRVVVGSADALFDVNVPDVPEITFSTLIEGVVEYEPAVVSEVSRLVDEARRITSVLGSAEQIEGWVADADAGARAAAQSASDAEASADRIGSAEQVEQWVNKSTSEANRAKTEADRAASSLSTKADKVHTHAISDVTSLQSTLDGKAPTVHTHATADINGLSAYVGEQVANSTQSGGAIESYAKQVVDQTAQTSINTALTTKADKTYVDTNLWVKPRVTSTIDTLTGASNAGLYPVSGSTTGLPVSTPGWVEVLYDAGTSRTRQRFTSSYAGDSYSMERTYASGAWSAWQPGQWRARELGASDNLDTLNTRYSQGLYSTLTSTAGLPKATPGWVEILWERAANRVSQVFTPATPADLGVTYKRMWADNTWTDWVMASSGTESIGQDVDLNTVIRVGRYTIASLYAINSPAPLLGSLTVTNAGGVITQSFTTAEITPREFKRTCINGMWNSWREPARTASRPMSWAPTKTYKASWETPAEISHNGKYWWSVRSYRLRISTDEGETWPLVWQKDGEGTEEVVALPNGEMMLITDGATDRIRRVYISEGVPTDPFTATWTKVLEGHAKHIKFPSGWSISTYDNIVLLSEYGPKANGAWQGDQIAEGNNARYVFMSEDYGKTWTTIWDLNAWLTGQGRGVTNQHPHGVAYDPVWKRIWLTFGDNFSGQGSNGVLYSDDKGTTWKIARFGSDANGTGQNGVAQVVGIIPLQDCIIFVGDQYPSGAMRIDRVGGKDRTTWNWHVAYQHWTGRHLGGMRKVSLPNGESVVVGIMTPEGVSTRSFVFATRDGYQWDVLWEDASDTPVATVGGTVVGPTAAGELIASLNDQSAAGKWAELRGPVDLYSSSAAASGDLVVRIAALERKISELTK